MAKKAQAEKKPTDRKEQLRMASQRYRNSHKVAKAEKKSRKEQMRIANK